MSNLQFNPIHESDSVEKIDGDTKIVGYVVQDDCSGQSFEWDLECNGQFEEFRDADSLVSRMKEWKELGLAVFLVDRYEHGNVHYSIAKTANYPDRQWDVATCAIYALPKEFTGEDAAEFANSILDEYSSWCNGEVYGAVWETFKKESCGHYHQKDLESCWEIIGYDNALEEMKTNI